MNLTSAILTFIFVISSFFIVDGKKGKEQEGPIIECRPGPCGKTGPEGFPGPRGAIGPQGPPGDDASNVPFTTSAFFNAFNQVAIANITDNSNIPLDMIQATSGLSDFVFDSQNYTVTILQSGIYFITFIVDVQNTVSQSAAIAVFAGNSEIPNSRSYNSNTLMATYGQTVYPITTGTVISLRNVSGATVDLRPDAGATINIKSSIMIIRVGGSTSMTSVTNTSA